MSQMIPNMRNFFDGLEATEFFDPRFYFEVAIAPFFDANVLKQEHLEPVYLVV